MVTMVVSENVLAAWHAVYEARRHRVSELVADLANGRAEPLRLALAAAGHEHLTDERLGRMLAAVAPDGLATAGSFRLRLVGAAGGRREWFVERSAPAHHPTSPDRMRALWRLTTRPPWTIPELGGVVVCMAWLDRFATPATRWRPLDKDGADCWACRYVTPWEMLVAAAALGYEIHPTTLRKSLVKWRPLVDPESTHRAASDLDVAAEHERLVAKLGRAELVPYAEWWPKATPEQVARAKDLTMASSWRGRQWLDPKGYWPTASVHATTPLTMRALVAIVRQHDTWRLPPLRRVVTAMAWLHEHTVVGATMRRLPKTHIEASTGQYVSWMDVSVAAAALGYEVDGESARWRFASRLDAEVVHRDPNEAVFDVEAAHRRLVAKLGRAELVPYATWWPESTPAAVEAAMDLTTVRWA